MSVLDGPTAADDGSLWYQVSVGDQVGYVIESFLANDPPADTSTDTSTDQPAQDAAPTQEAAQPTGPVYTIGGTNGEGARCRAAASADAQIIVIIPEGTTIQITGDAADGWQPVTCNDQPGFVTTQFVAVDGVLPPAPTEVVTEEPTEVVTEAPTDVVTEEPTEAVTEEVTEAPTEAVTDEATEEPTEAVTDESDDATDEPTQVDDATVEPTDEATEVATEATDDATVEPTDEATQAATEDATQVATEEPTQETIGGSTETPTETATATEDATKTGTPTAESTKDAATATPKPTKTPKAKSPTATAVPTMGTPVLSGTAIVFGTNGGGVRCRATADDTGTVLAVLAEGAVVQTNGDAKSGWQPVICDGQAGYVLSDFILLDRLGATSGDASSDVSSTVKSAKIAGTNGDGLRCRASASTSGAIIVVLNEGTSLSLRSGSSGSWQAVTCAGQKGFVSNEFLSYDGVTAKALVAAASTSSSTPNVTGSAIVSGTNGDGVRCRAKNSYDAAVLLVLKEGATVKLRGSQRGDWQPVYCGTTAGYIVADYLSNVTKSASTSSGSSSSTTKTAKVVNTGGTGVRLRASASSSSSIITVVPEGASVTIRSGSTGDWTAVKYNGSNGFIYKSYLSATTSSSSSGSSSSGSSSGSSSSATGLKSGQRAKTTANVNLRYSASMSAGIAAVAPTGTVVLITGSISNGFYPVDWDGLDGFISGDYLLHTKLALTSSGGSASGGSTSVAAAPPAGARRPAGPRPAPPSSITRCSTSGIPMFGRPTDRPASTAPASPTGWSERPRA